VWACGRTCPPPPFHHPQPDLTQACPITSASQGGQECCRLLPYRQGRLLLLLQLQEGQALLTPELAALLLALVQPRCAALQELLAAELAGPGSTWHVRGARYLYLERACCAARWARAAPPRPGEGAAPLRTAFLSGAALLHCAAMTSPWPQHGG
jgi:hypothetical protein